MNKVKNIVWIVLLLLVSPAIGFAQSFEGMITHANTRKSNPQLKDRQLEAMMVPHRISFQFPLKLVVSV